jgi:hypothetical protein
MKSQRPRRIVAGLVSLAMIGLVGTLGATAASAASPPSFTGPGIGPQPKGLGLGSKAALAQANCNDNGRTSLALEGLGPYCVNPWKAGANNGGATSPGVTKDSVKAIIYIDNEQMAAAAGSQQPPVNQATGKNATVKDGLADTLKAYEQSQKQLQTYQTWGRTVDFQVVEASGADEASQRADATEVAAMKPFIVYDNTKSSNGGAPVFTAALAAKKIITISPSTTPALAKASDPYRWGFNTDNTASLPLTASFVANSLAGEKAQWAGDSDLKSKTRSFGLVYPNDTTFDLTDFQAQLTKNGGPKLAGSVSFDPNNPQQAADGAATTIQKMKDSGVTSVVLFATAPLITGMMTAATAQDYHPEWIFTGYQYQDYDGYARGYPQDQMKQAFGLSVLWPYAEPPTGLTADITKWYWGTGQGNVSTTLPAVYSFIYGAVQYSGPDLTPQNVRKGLFSVPATEARTGRAGYGFTTGMPYPEYAAGGTDRALAFWDGATTGPSQPGAPIAQGVFQYVDGGTRYTFTNMPKTEPKFFDTKGAVIQVPYATSFPGGVIPPVVPCNGCPSSGATTGSSS